jgi:3-oxoacyl-[acyl-carrier protein] reductase
MTGLLAGRVAVVTGAAHGIGLATARKLVEEGATVVAADVDGEALGRLASQHPGSIVPVVGDLMDDGAPEHLVAHALETAGKIDIIVNNAGFSWDAPMSETTDERWESLLKVLVTVPFRIARAVGPHFKAQADAENAAGEEGPYRKVVSVGALEAVVGRPGAVNYSAANAALIGFTNGLAREWARLRVTANTVAFGPVQTRLLLPQGPFNRISVGGYDVQSGLAPALLERLGVPEEPKAHYEDAEVYGGKRRLGELRPVTVAEAAGTILYLCSSASDQVTGTMHAVGTPRRF